MTEDLPATAIAPSTPEAGGILTPAPNTTECNDTEEQGGCFTSTRSRAHLPSQAVLVHI
jgi:hypothetical protein